MARLQFITERLKRLARSVRPGSAGSALTLGSLALLATLMVLTAARAAITYVSASEVYDPDLTNTLTVNRPSGVAAGDLLLAAVTIRGNHTINTPSGWTGVVTSQLDNLNNPNLRVFYRVAGGSEPANYTFTTSGSESIAIGVAAFRGIDTANPIAASAVQANNTASTSGVAPSVTPGVADAMLVSLWATHDNGGDEPKLTVPASMTRVVGSTMMADNTAETRLTMARELLTASTATGTRTAALSSSYRTNTASVALRPGGYTVSGTVFEDVNYGGGAGRTLAASGGAGLNGATVELYNGSGVYVSSMTTAAGGAYSFAALASGTYYVRVVNSTVASQRSGTTGSLRGVMTYRTTATSGSAVAVADHVGGTSPALVDPGAGSSGATFNTGTGVYSAVLSGTAQSFAPVTVGSANITGIDFGFNFDTVVNVNDSGPGSLRQAITNANTLGGDASLAQSGRTSGVEHLVFMISNGTSAAGLRSANNLFVSGVATIATGSALPSISTSMVLNAQAQPGWSSAPLVDLNGSGAGSGVTGLSLNGGSSTVRGFVVRSFTSSGIGITGGSNHTVAGNYIGTNAAGTAAAGNGTEGINLFAVGGVTIGGSTAADRNLLSGNANNGLVVTGSGATATVRGNYVGLNAAGTGAVANGSLGIYIGSSGSVIGGTAAGAGNVISGNTHSGLVLFGGTTVQGNLIGLNAAGTTALANGDNGIYIGATNNVIGGTAGSARNVIAGNGGDGIEIGGSGATGTVVQGNYIGTDSAGTTVRANGASGVYILGGAANNTIGGTAAGSGNLIRGNGSRGVRIEGAGTGNAVLGNAIHGHAQLGIDLAGNGVSANDGAKTSGQPNLLMDAPVITSAVLSGSTLTVAGYVGNAANQSSFASARVEIFTSDNDASGYGEGQALIGALTTDANGNFAGSLAVPGGVTVTAGSTRVTGTATDGSNNTSEFGANVIAEQLSIAGTVFEDLHYGGGAGRSLAAAGGAGMAGATVELYRATGSLVASTTTAGNGSYSFGNLSADSYVVRVVTGTLLSTRSGSTGGLWPVQTWRHESSRLTPTEVSSEVGGQQPGVADSGAAPTLGWTQCATESGGSANPCAFSGTRLVRFGTGSSWTTRVATGGVSCSTAVFGDPAVGSGKSCEVLQPHLHSASSVYLGTAAVAGMDFGYSFDTVVHTQDSGQGSLRQAITNANTLGGDAALAQSGRSAGIEHIVFMIGNGSSAAGLRSAHNFFTTAAGSTTAATITLASRLPTVSAPLVIDAQTQPGWTLQPRIEVGGGGVADGLMTISAGNSTLRGLVVNRMVGGTALRLDTAGGNTIQGNWFGPDASGSTATVAQRTYFQIEVYSGANTIGGASASARNVIGNSQANGIVMRSGNANVIQGNYIGTNAQGNAAMPNVDSGIVFASNANATNTVIGGLNAGEGNVISGNSAAVVTTGGIAIQGMGNTGTLIRGNTIGLNAAGSAALASGRSGIYIAGPGTVVGGTAAGAGNTISGQAGDGITVAGDVTGVAILGNRIHGNGALGIDLQGGTGVNANDGSKTSGQPNLLMDQPVFTGASLSGNTLTVTGHVGSTAGQSTFANARVEVFVSDQDASGHGEGQTYLGFVTSDASGNFNGPITLPGGVTLTAGSTRLTGTATDTSNNSSEFGPNFTYGLSISGTVFEDLNYGGGAGRSLAASGGVGVSGATVELYRASGAYVGSTTTDSGGGYGFTELAAEGHVVRVLTSSVRSTRAGSIAGLWPVQTWRQESSWLTPGAVTGEVGGQQPGVADSAAALSLAWASCAAQGATCNVTGTRLVRYGVDVRWVTRVVTGNVSCSNAVFGDPAFGVSSKSCQVLQPPLHSASSVHLTNAPVAAVDFGFSFGTVTHTGDAGQGSLRQAITNANTLGGDAGLAQSGRSAAIEHLVFMISNGSSAAGLRSANNFFSGGIASIAPASALPALSTPMTIDAQMQPGWTLQPIVELRGDGAGTTAGLVLSAGASTLRGLIVNRFNGAGLHATGGAGHTIQGNWIGLNAAGTAAAANTGTGLMLAGGGNGHSVGGTTAAQRNVISGNGSYGIDVWNGSGHVVQGNYIGTAASGNAAVGNSGRGVYFSGASSASTLGGTAAGAGNVISGNNDYGVWLNGTAITVQGNLIGLGADGDTALGNAAAGLYAPGGGHLIGGPSAAARNVVAGHGNARGIWLNSTGNTVQGNYVGTNAAGTAARPNQDGIYVKGANNQIGGSAAGAGNLVSGNSRYGVHMHADGTGSVLQGHVIGRNAAGNAALPNAVGVLVQCADTGCAVGGTAAGAGNTIAGNTGIGVSITANSGHAVLGNAIHGNGSLGIDLNADGLSANDGVKTAGQPNLLMDQPVITSARARGNQLTVAGHIGTAAGQSLFAGSRVEIFESDNDGSGHGEGRSYLGALTADGSGNFSGTLTMPVATLAIGTRLTGTATDTASNTSEFGAQFTGLVVDFVVISNLDEVDNNLGDGQCLTASGVCTLRAAIAELNAWSSLPTAPTVTFALPSCPGAGCVITPAGALPTLSRAMVIDAQTQAGWALAPIVELRGSSAGSTHGLDLTAPGSTVRGLVIGGFGQDGDYAGIRVAASNTTIEGNWIGLAADGLTARRNGASNATSGGVHVVSGTGIVIGGSTAAQRNVLSGNGGAGVWTDGGSATIVGNYIGTDASGSAALGNERWGLQIAGGSHQIGGAAAGQGNVISGNTGHQEGGIFVGSSGQTIQGNTIGLNAARTAAIPNGSASSTYDSGIDLRPGSSGHLIGGTNPGEGNVIAGNAGHGVRVMSQTTRVLGNSIHGNQWLGIDLNADGVTANDGAVSGSAPNNGLDFPVVTSAGYDGGTRVLTVAGYVGTGTGQATFAGARIEFFASDGDGSGYGEGRDYLGTLTADGNGRYSGSITVPGGVSFAVGAPMTATATDTAGHTSEFGPNYVVTTVSALLPSRFNLFETGTAANELSGAIKTMTAGQARTLAAIAIDQAGTGLAAAFGGSVSLQWMDARDNAGALDAGGCRSSWVAGASAGTAAFVSGTPRRDVSLTPPAAGREWRLRISHTSGNGSVVTACTTDNFAIKPASIAVTALGSADSRTAGVGGSARSLVNASASGGVVHRAGRPFALRAEGQDAGGALTAGYDGSAAIAITACLLPASGCTLGSLQHNGGAASLSAVAGALSSDAMTYSEVGAIGVRLSDTSFADIDAADSTPAERLIQSAEITIGRFVPDQYATSVTTPGVLATANAACTAAGAGYTFFGQAFGWATAPQFSVTAQNAQGATTVNWAGGLQRLDPVAHVAQSLAVSGVASALSQTHGGMTLTDLGGGSARLTAQATSGFALARDTAAPVASATPSFGWAAAIVDASEAAITGNGSITGTAAQSGLAFSGGGVFHTGRLALAPGHGDARRGVRLLVELQRYSAAGWVTMTEDRGCISVAPMNVTLASPHGVFASAGLCAAPVQAAVTLRGGRAWMSLPATPGQAPGRLVTGLDLGSASTGLACPAVGVSGASQPMNLPHLMGAWGGVSTLTADPRAPLTWGRPNRDMVLSRERF